MAYISQDEKKNLAPGINAVLKKHGYTGTISIRDNRTIRVKLKSGPFDMAAAGINDFVELNNIDRWDNGCPKELSKFVPELKKALMGPDWYDKSDIMTDYFHVKHYYSIRIGENYTCTV